MENTYNKVEPLHLGGSRGKKRVNVSNKNVKEDINSFPFLSVPPPPPPLHSYPLPPPPMNFSGVLPSNHLDGSKQYAKEYSKSSLSGTSYPSLQETSQSWNHSNIPLNGNHLENGLPGVSGVLQYNVSNNGNHMGSYTKNGDINQDTAVTDTRALPKPTTSGTFSPNFQDTYHVNSSDLPHQLSVYMNQSKSGKSMESQSSWHNLVSQRLMTQNNGSPLPLGNNKKKRKTSSNISKNKNGKGIDLIGSADEADKRRKRAERFNVGKKNVSSTSLHDEENFANLNAISTKSHKFDKNKRIVGRCQALEKSYLRLTSEPNPDLVRPLNVLKKTYNMLMKKYQKGQVSYQYLCDQFKSMRQDLRVQIIENQFTVKVYESHARIALGNDDMGEFNQCQSRLIALFDLPNIKPSFLEEFTSYRILYYMLTEDNGAMNTLRLKLMTENPAVFSNHMVRTAFKLAHARLMGDYHHFMKLYASMKDLGKKLVDSFICKEKLKSLVTICRSYNQINADFIIEELQFKDKEDMLTFFQKRNLDKYFVTKNMGEESEFQYLDAKACRSLITQQYSESKKIDIKGQQ